MSSKSSSGSCFTLFDMTSSSSHLGFGAVCERLAQAEQIRTRKWEQNARKLIEKVSVIQALKPR